MISIGKKSIFLKKIIASSTLAFIISAASQQSANAAQIQIDYSGTNISGTIVIDNNPTDTNPSNNQGDYVINSSSGFIIFNGLKYFFNSANSSVFDDATPTDDFNNDIDTEGGLLTMDWSGNNSVLSNDFFNSALLAVANGSFGTGIFTFRGERGIIDSFRISEVPLPAALPMMASGLALLGWAGYRRRRSLK